jgi:dipeptidyl aminopeptidase/acylaminoacyl peptidase
MEMELSFFSDGERVVGTLALPEEGQGKAPAAVLVHGYGSFRDELTGYVELAALLAAHGIASLRLDMRGCGESGALGRIHPHDDWIADITAALSYLESRPEVDPARLGLVGMSVGGGAVVQAGAVDERVRCVVSLAPVADGGWWLKHLWTTTRGESDWQGFLARLAADRRMRAQIGRSEKVAVEDVLAYGPEDAKARVQMLQKYPQFATYVYLSSPDSLCRFQPRHWAHLVAPRPLRIIHSLTDTSVPITHAYELYGRAGAPKDIQVIPDSPHCFWLGPHSRRVQELTLEWLRLYL